MSNREIAKIAREIKEIKASLNKTSDLTLDWESLMSDIVKWSRKNNLGLQKPKLKSLSGSGQPRSDEDAYISVGVEGLDNKRNEVVVDTIMVTMEDVSWGEGSKVVALRNKLWCWEKEVMKILNTKVLQDPKFGMYTP